MEEKKYILTLTKTFQSNPTSDTAIVACRVFETYSQLGILVIITIYLSSRSHVHRSSPTSCPHGHQITKVPITKKKYTILSPHCVPCVSHQDITVARHWGATLRSKRLGLMLYVSRLIPHVLSSVAQSMSRYQWDLNNICQDVHTWLSTNYIYYSCTWINKQRGSIDLGKSMNQYISSK